MITSRKPLQLLTTHLDGQAWSFKIACLKVRTTDTHSINGQRQDLINMQSWAQTCPSINISYKKGSLLLLTINGRPAAVSSCSGPIPNHHLVNLLMNTSPSFCQAPKAYIALKGLLRNNNLSPSQL